MNRSRTYVTWFASLLMSVGANGLYAQQTTAPAKDPKSDELVELSPFTVTSKSEVGYGATLGTTGRLAAPYIDTPQAASIVTSELMQDANLYESNSAHFYTPSVKSDSVLQGTTLIRGLTTGSTYTDGFLNAAGMHFHTFFSDRLEIVRGPSSASFGRGDPAGFLNYVSKLPQFNKATEVGLMVGTGNSEKNSFRAILDTNGLATVSGRTAYRFVAVFDEGAQTMDRTDYRHAGAQLAVSHKLSNRRGRLDVVGTFQRNDTPGLAFSGNSSSQVYKDFYRYFYRGLGITVPDFPLVDNNFSIAMDGTGVTDYNSRLSAVFSYKLSDHWDMRQAASIHKMDTSGGTSFGEPHPRRITQATDGTWLYEYTGLAANYGSENGRSWQSDFLGNYDVGQTGAKLNVLLGGDS